MTVETPPSVARLLVNYLLSRTEVTALVGDRIYGEVTLPPNPVYPLVSMHRAGGTATANSHLDNALFQVEAYAANGDAVGLETVVRAVRSVLRHEVIVGNYAEGVVTGMYEISGPSWAPDLAEGRDRYAWVVQVFVHPIP